MVKGGWRVGPSRQWEQVKRQEGPNEFGYVSMAMDEPEYRLRITVVHGKALEKKHDEIYMLGQTLWLKCGEGPCWRG